ncbi:MAG: amidase family protein [Bauldia sp.]
MKDQTPPPKPPNRRGRLLRAATVLFAAVGLGSSAVGVADSQEPTPFSVVEATIASTHAAIQAGQVTCAEIVQQYIDRARAYNGVCTALVTADGADVPAVEGYTRTGEPITFPTATVAASTIFPNLDQYTGLPIDYGRMETTISNPAVYAQMGLRVGIPNAGQINALETFNIRGERSVTCAGPYDAHPSTGPLPPDAPPECEAFRQQPDSLERAAELDALYGMNPPLDEMPLYCIVTVLKDPYETSDMRATANSDVAFAMDAPPLDSPIAAQLRSHGAIIFAKTTAHEFNAGPGNPGGPNETLTNLVSGGQAISAWSGQACNPYDTTRVPRGSSSGVGAAIGANLGMIGVCEQTAASCQGPASRNGSALMLASQGILPGLGGIGNSTFIDRPGIITRTLADAAVVLSAVNDGEVAYDLLRTPFTVPSALIPDDGYVPFVVTDEALAENPRPLEGVTIAIFREYMRYQTANHVAISDQINEQILTVLRDQLGATLIEVTHPDYEDDPDIPNAEFTFADALSRVLPAVMPEIFSRRDADGELMFEVEGWDVTSVDYLRALAAGEAPLPGDVRLTNFAGFGALDCDECDDWLYNMNNYLAARGDRVVTDWAAWVANAKFRQDSSRAGAENWIVYEGSPTNAGAADGLLRSYVGRLALQMMMAENGIDVFVHPENTVPTPLISGPNVGTNSFESITPFLQIPRVVVPAGMNDIVVEPAYALNEARTNYISVLPEGATATTMEHPMPIAITFFANQGDEPLLITVGTAYESATHHRVMPPDFGPL